jgi:cytosine/adenosine deaminase-related metal-dependent hydrolase
MQQAPPSIWLTGARIAVNAHETPHANLEIANGRILNLTPGPPPPGPAIDLRNYLLLPGLINCHDHLEFNLFPRLGHGPYAHSGEWARDIYHPDRSPLREHLSVPKPVRLFWGGIKNLLSGVTTVCHHNPHDAVFEEAFPVQVVRRYGWAHSISFEKDVAQLFAATPPHEPFIIHAGEGTDERSRDEVFELDRMGALDRRTILVHGVAFSRDGHALRTDRGAALVWCPTSNRFILGTTLDVQSLDNLDTVALGSDSALTAQGNLLDEIHAAREEGAPADSIYRMVTETAAAILRLHDGEGRLEPGSIANLIAIPWKEKTPADAVAQMDLPEVEMVLVAGQLQLASAEMLKRWDPTDTDGLEWIFVDGLRRKIRAPISWLIRETIEHLHDGIHLAGRRIFA